MELNLNQKVKMKKPHPCGCDVFEITRVGMDIKLKCISCGREVMLPRKKAEKAIKTVIEEV